MSYLGFVGRCCGGSKGEGCGRVLEDEVRKKLIGRTE